MATPKTKKSSSKCTELIPFNNLSKDDVNTKLITQVKDLQVTQAAEYTYACDFRTYMKVLEKSVRDYHEPMIKAAHAAHKQACDRMNATLAPIKEVTALLDSKVNQYLTEERRKADELRRIEEERLRKEAEEQKARDIAEALKMGDKKLVKAIKQEEIEIGEVTVPTEVPQIDGIQKRTVVEIVDVDIKALCTAISKGKVPENCVAPVVAALKSFYKLSGEPVPGVTFEESVKVGGSVRRYA